MIQCLKAPNLIRHVLLELSTLCRWKETCDIECWGLRQPLSEYSFFYPLGAQKLFGENWQFSINSYEFNVRPLTDTVSRSIDGPDMTSWKPIANLCLNCYFETFLTLLKNPLKWLAEEMIQLLKAPNLIRHVLLELSTLCRWKETCDIECWGLRQPLSEYSCFLPTRCPRNCLVKTDIFSIHSYEFNVRPLTDTVSRSIDGPDMTSWKPIANLCLNCYF